MRTTRVVKISNALVVIIPAELAYDRTDIEFEIERDGVELRIVPARRSLAGALAKFATFSQDFMEGGRHDHEQSERDEMWWCADSGAGLK